MNLITMYRLFKKQDKTIWKVEPVLIPENDVSYWKETGDILSEEDLKLININILK